MTGAPSQNKKRHHFVPVVYLKGFCDSSSRVFTYINDANKLLHLAPSEIAFERHYYSQPTPDGTMDHNKLEDFFQTYENTWPSVLAAINSEEIDHTLAEQLFGFIGLMRVRVPATRDMVETSLASEVLALARQLDKAEKLPPKPVGHEDILDKTVVSVDPHRSLHAMSQLAIGFGKILDQMGFEIIRDNTQRGFLTTDNAVIFFDPDASMHTMRPYTWNPQGGRIELFFPLDAHTTLHGITDLRQTFVRHGFHFRNVMGVEEIKRINRLQALFGYKMAFARDKSHQALMKKFASISPVVSSSGTEGPQHEEARQLMIFGKRPTKPKWKYSASTRAGQE